MDPITAINLEFARQVRASWSQEVTDRLSERTAPARLARPVARLRVIIGKRLIAVGTWMKAPGRLAGAKQ